MLAALLIGFAPLAAEESFLSEEDLFEEELGGGVRVSDPFESINRVTFGFNDFVILHLVQPLAKGYQTVTPDPVEKGATNFFRNLRYPVRLAGNVLQGRLDGVWVETGRFAINSTVGLLGVFTPADRVNGFERIPREDLGQAFGSWGIGEGAYLVLPFLGPSNVRDLGGFLGDRVVNPLEEPVSLIDDWNWEWPVGIGLTEFTVASPSLVDRYVQMKGSAIDPYSSVRNAYTQFRRAAIEE